MSKASKDRGTPLRNVNTVVREMCLGYPETEEVSSHGSPDFRVRGKTFATYTVNHHGDGHVGLWLRSPPGAQELYTEMEPEQYYVPPYVGPKGWLGVELNQQPDWLGVARRVFEAYEFVAPAALAKGLTAIEIDGPIAPLTAQEVDPFQSSRGKAVVEKTAQLCLALPETAPATQFGSPVWKAGKKTFCGTHYRRGRLQLTFWVGPEQQALLTFDERYSIPPYTGHNGWIELDVEDDANWEEVANLALSSYRHFALKRMLKSLDVG